MFNNMELIIHSSLRINYQNKIIYIDPYTLNNKYFKDADYIFITHNHYDHFSEDDIISIRKLDTKIIIPYDLRDKVIKLGFNIDNILLVEPDNNYQIDNIKFMTIPSYNMNKPFHKREYNWVGYLLYLDEVIYIAGDTDIIPEARQVKCDIACVPIGGVYTMDVLEAVNLIKEIKPHMVIPIHYGSVVGTKEDAERFKELLKDITRVEIIMGDGND